jgi:hypothetical protein
MFQGPKCLICRTDPYSLHMLCSSVPLGVKERFQVALSTVCFTLHIFLIMLSDHFLRTLSVFAKKVLHFRKY